VNAGLRDVLLLVDVISDFEHGDGDALAGSFARAQPALRAAIARARERGVPVVYANDSHGDWSGERSRQIAHAAGGRAGALVAEIAPAEGDAYLVKPRYSAFDATPLALVLDGMGAERVLLAGTATEMCVAQTAIQARELGLKVSVLVDACAHVDEADARVALAYLESVVGARLERVYAQPVAGTGEP
jgi:nicotinamidase-related amidase